MEIELEGLHLAILAVTFICIIIADHDAVQYLRGVKQILDIKKVKRLHYAVTGGLIGMIITGFFMFQDAWGELIGEPAFYIKMCMVLALIANGFVIGNLMHIATLTPFKDLAPQSKRKLFISGAVSGICWLGSAGIGMFFL